MTPKRWPLHSVTSAEYEWRQEGIRSEEASGEVEGGPEGVKPKMMRQGREMRRVRSGTIRPQSPGREFDRVIPR